MVRGPEAKIEDAFVTEMVRQGHLCPKLRWDGRNGWPDRTLITRWGIRFYEFKALGGSVSRAQNHIHRLLTEQGFRVVIAYSLEEAIEDFKSWELTTGRTSTSGRRSTG